MLSVADDYFELTVTNTIPIHIICSIFSFISLVLSLSIRFQYFNDKLGNDKEYCEINTKQKSTGKVQRVKRMRAIRKLNNKNSNILLLLLLCNCEIS